MTAGYRALLLGSVVVGFVAMIAPAIDASGGYLLANTLIPIALFSLVSSFAAIKLANEHAAALWAPVLWYCVSSAVYYGFGPLIHVVGSQESIDFLNAYYPVSDRSLYATNTLNFLVAVSMLALYSLFRMIPHARATLPSSAEISMPAHRRKMILVALLAVLGLLIDWFVIIPHEASDAEATLPGAVKQIRFLSLIAIVPLTILSVRKKGVYVPLAALVVGVTVLLAIVSLSKFRILLPIVLWIIAYSYAKRDLTRLVVGSVTILLLYSVLLSPFISYSRILVGRNSAANLDEVGASIADFSTAARALSETSPGIWAWWTRLCYSNSQASAMELYEQGNQGDTLALAAYALVPRALYSDKPIMTSGLSYTELVTGAKDPTSSTGPGSFAAEGYWNYGYAGVALLCFLLSVAYVVTERIAISAIRTMDIWKLPLVVYGLNIGLHADTWFVPLVVGSVPPVIAMCGALYLLEKLVLAGGGRVSSHLRA